MIGDMNPPRPWKQPPPQRVLVTESDREMAEIFGIDLEGPEKQAKQAIADLEIVLQLADKWMQRAETWRVRWCWTFGAMMVLVIIVIALLICR